MFEILLPNHTQNKFLRSHFHAHELRALPSGRKPLLRGFLLISVKINLFEAVFISINILMTHSIAIFTSVNKAITLYSIQTFQNKVYL